MTQRLTFAALGFAALTVAAVTLGDRWLFLAAAVSAAVAWMWHGWLGWREGKP